MAKNKNTLTWDMKTTAALSSREAAASSHWPSAMWDIDLVYGSAVAALSLSLLAAQLERGDVIG